MVFLSCIVKHWMTVIGLWEPGIFILSGKMGSYRWPLPGPPFQERYLYKVLRWIFPSVSLCKSVKQSHLAVLFSCMRIVSFFWQGNKWQWKLFERQLLKVASSLSMEDPPVLLSVYFRVSNVTLSVRGKKKVIDLLRSVISTARSLLISCFHSVKNGKMFLWMSHMQTIWHL